MIQGSIADWVLWIKEATAAFNTSVKRFDYKKEQQSESFVTLDESKNKMKYEINRPSNFGFGST